MLPPWLQEGGTADLTPQLHANVDQHVLSGSSVLCVFAPNACQSQSAYGEIWLPLLVLGSSCCQSIDCLGRLSLELILVG